MDASKETGHNGSFTTLPRSLSIMLGLTVSDSLWRTSKEYGDSIKKAMVRAATIVAG